MDKCSDKKLQKELKDLEKQKNKAKEKGNLVEAAKLCNCLGEILSENGYFEDAVQEHQQEVYFSEATNDVIGVAVGNRKIGECLCELGQFEEAIKHQQKHLKIANSVANYPEQQRALATIGRTYFVQAERLTNDGMDNHNIKECLIKSQEAYVKSLDVCNKLKGDLKEKEILEMKARLYLNLGLVYENKLNYKEAMKFVSKALVISKEHHLQEDIFRCHLTLFGLYLNDNNVDKALQSAKSALMISQKENNKTNEMESLSQMGLALLKLGNFTAALNTLRKVYKYTEKTCGVDPIVSQNLKLAMKFIKFTTSYEKCEDKKELLAICEHLGDLYSDLGHPEKALKFYSQQLDVANALNLTGKSLAPIFVSLAITYSDCKQYNKALEYHKKELDVKQGDPVEKSTSYCNIATCLEKLDVPFDEIKEAYMKALEYVQGSGNHTAELKVYQDWSETLNSYGFTEECNNVQSKMKHIRTEYDTLDTENDSQEQDTDKSFTHEELQMLESDDEGDMEEKEMSRGNRKSSVLKKKANKVNERGETPLHCAAINGEYDRAKNLLLQGASVFARDYCGWTPLHEACNHGHFEIAELLIQHQADVNDPGGSHCGKITPLHDASQNGHIKVVELLVASGASVWVKNSDGKTPLELVQESIEADEEEFSSNSTETAINKRRKAVKDFLLKCQRQPGHKAQADTPKNRNDKIFDDLFGDDSDSDRDISHVSKRRKTSNVQQNIENIPPLFQEKSTIVAEKISDSDTLSIPDHLSDSDGYAIDSLTPTPTDEPTYNSVLMERKEYSKQTSRSIKLKPPLKITNNVIDLDIFSSTPCTSLIPEEVSAIKDFIVDDMGTKRKRQSKISYTELDRQKQKNSHSRNKPRTSNTTKTKKPRQKRIDGYTEEVDIFDTSSNDSIAPEVSSNQEVVIVPTANSSINIKQNNLFRVKIRINEKFFLISVPNGNELTIEWLLGEAKTRYQNVCGISTKLLLKTQDGALLNSSDFIVDVIMNNEELVGEVTGLDFPSDIERYRTACKTSNVEIISEVEEQFSSSPNLTDLSVNEIFLSKFSLGAICNSISCNATLTVLNFSHTIIGDINFSLIVDVLQSLPLLNTLIFTCIGITTKSLQELSTILSDSIKEEYRLVLKEPPLTHISKIHLDYNDFSNQNQFICAMSKLLSHCKNMTEINLESCQLCNEIFHPHSQFYKALKESQISNLNLSYNCLGGSDFFSNMFQSLNKTFIQSIDLGFPLHSDKRGFNLDDMWGQLEHLDQLKELKLSSLSDGFIKDRSDVSIENLSICDPNCDSLTLTSVFRCIKHFNSLVYLDLSCLKNLDNNVLEVLLVELKSTTLKKLLLCNCSIQSPLTNMIFLQLGMCSTSLCFIDLSYNEIVAEDKSKLFDAWYTVHQNKAAKQFTMLNCVLLIKQ